MTTAETAGRRPDVPALTGLRFLAAFSVLLAHGLSATLTNNEPPKGAVLWLMQASGFGMTLFFVLSGFVIHYNYAGLVTGGRLRGIAAFLWARFARLYPLFLLMMLVYVLVSQRHVAYWTGRPEDINAIFQALPYFLLSIQSWIYKLIGGGALIDAIRGGSPPTWSISTEWFFYFAYPLIAWFILRARAPAIILLVIGIWCVLWTAFSTGLYDRTPQIDAWAVDHFGPIAEMQNHDDSFVRWLLYVSPYLRIGEFVLGAITAQLYIALQRRDVSRRENTLGGCDVLGGGIERPPGHLFGIQSRRSDDDLPQNEHELRFGAVGGAAYLLRRPLSKRGVAALDVAPRHRARRGELLDIPGALDRADQRREADREASCTAPPTMC